jgi:hypothetical protein
MCSRPNCGDGRAKSRLFPRNEDVIKAFAELSISMCFIHESPQLGTVPRMDSHDVAHTRGYSTEFNNVPFLNRSDMSP